jgi:hypothetical protein
MLHPILTIESGGVDEARDSLTFHVSIGLAGLVHYPQTEGGCSTIVPLTDLPAESIA